MIVYDKEQKEIVIPNGIGNINLFNNGVEAGYNQGKIDGIEEQKSKLESINITENGTYTKEDGYNEIVVDVPDLNGSYDEGYEQGKIYMESNARVLNVTENGVYRSEFSDDMPPIGYTVTGVYADGTEFHSCAELNGAVYNTKIMPKKDSRLEFWFTGKNTDEKKNEIIISSTGTFKIKIQYEGKNNRIGAYVGRASFIIKWENTVWHHLIVSPKEGFWIDGERVGKYPLGDTYFGGEFFINGDSGDNNNNSNGTFGMIKIDDTIIIPTADGFLNTNTGELLEVVKDGGYTFTESLPIYGEGVLYKTINVNVPDLNGSYDEGYAQGKINGINEQKSKLESISITENGTYTKEDGYNHIEVNVPDLNGSYDEGYNQGQADVAANARVLNVTENGNYLSKFSDPVIPTLVTGRYADGTDFYNYAELKGKVFNTNILATTNSRVELWYKGDNTLSGDAFNVIIGANYMGDSIVFEVIYNITSNSEVSGRIGSYVYDTNWDENIWHHIILSKNDGFIVDGAKIGDMQSASYTSNGNFLINANDYNNQRNANGYFGMIKIDDTIIIPTADGFKNVNTGELLEVVKDGAYTFTENLPIYGEGELYKTINVNVLPKVNVKKTGLKLGHSTFTEVPEWVDFEGITDMSNMFNNCGGLQTIPLIDTSNVTNMNYMFGACSNLRTIPLLNTSSVTEMIGMFQSCGHLQTIPLIDTSNVINMGSMFSNCSSLQTIPMIDTSNVINMGSMFYSCSNLTSLPALNAQSLNMGKYGGFFGYSNLPKLTDFGGLLNLKYSLTNDNNLKRLPNLTYESCINVLNVLYDFSGNGEVPNSEQGQLKVHQNFLDKVGDEISIGVNKGWTITV